MGKALPDPVLDQMLDEIATATKLIVCSAEPTTYNEANVTYNLASVVLDAGDFTKADDTSGRKVTISAQSPFIITASGTATHLALVRTVDSTLLAVTTCASQALVDNDANTVETPAFKISISDPT